VNRPDTEYIIISAVWYDDGKKYHNQPVDTGIVICGHRHHNCLNNISMLFKDAENHGLKSREQGFLTNLGRYVDRYEAYAIEYGSNPENKRLFSEDIFPVGGY
jgi:hypothetical protein